MTAESSKAVVRAFVEATDRHDLGALQAHPGLHETVQHMPLMWVSLPDARHTIEQQFAEGDMVATRATVRGTHQGTFMGVAPTGREVAFMVLMMDQVVDGKIVLHFALPDMLSLLVSLGVIPNPVPPQVRA